MRVAGVVSGFYGHGPEVYQRSAEELIPAVNATVNLLRRALGVTY